MLGENVKKSLKVQYVCGGFLLAFLLLTCIIYYWNYDDLMSKNRKGVWVLAGSTRLFSSLFEKNKMAFNPADRLLKFFSVDDGLAIKWYHGTNSLSQLQDALDRDYMMLEGDIILRWWGLPNQTDEPIMAHPPAVNTDITLDNWLNRILAQPDKGLKLDFKSLEVVRPSLELLYSKKELLNRPVLVNAAVLKGPGKSGQPVDAKGFLAVVNELWPKASLSLGWTTTCCLPFTRAMMEEMLAVAMNTTQPVTFPARASSFKDSWPHYKWLLEQDPNRFTITVWTPSGANDWEGASIHDLLYIRNDCSKRLIYYDLPGPKFDQFKQLSVTAGSLFNHFPMEKRDGLTITWAHAVNSQKELTDALDGDIMMLEADVLLQGQGTPKQRDIPIMVHPPDTTSDITLEGWVNRVLTHDSHKGIKLDLKSVEVLEPVMKVLQKRKSDFVQPVWINADVFVGPNIPIDQPVNATEFKRIVGSYFPESTLSIGWTTRMSHTASDRGYSAEMIAKMADYVRDLQQPITFPVRAALVKRSWEHLKKLLDQSRAYTLTIWTGKNDVVEPDDLVYIRSNYDIDRIFYDLPEPLMKEFLAKLAQTKAN